MSRSQLKSAGNSDMAVESLSLGQQRPYDHVVFQGPGPAPGGPPADTGQQPTTREDLRDAL